MIERSPEDFKEGLTMMSIPLEQVIERFSPARQKRIQEKADHYIQEYKTLQALRKALHLTQTDVVGNFFNSEHQG